MSRQKLRVHRAPLDNIVSNLRGEIGEIIFTWVLWRDLIIKSRATQTGDFVKDAQSPELCMLSVLTDRLGDDIVARLSELAEEKVGRLNFHFAQLKLGALESEVKAFCRFIDKNGFREKRNFDISRNELPEQWSEHRILAIPYKTVLRGIAHALRLMKRIDRKALGPSAPYLWRQMRKKRYTPMSPVKAGHLILPYFRLTEEERAAIIQEEMAEGKIVWQEVPTVVDGTPRTVIICKRWGAMLFGPNTMRLLPHYPIQEISSIDTQTGPADGNCDKEGSTDTASTSGSA